MTTASAPGKVILCGEHAVVYGHPAIALPLPDVRATATVESSPPGSGVVLTLPDLGERLSLAEYATHPLALLLRLTAERLGVHPPINLHMTLHSAIPIASGMGSGAALGAALVKAFAAHYESPLAAPDVSALVYESERVFHGTPSGIDNTVVSYEQAIWFVRRRDGDSTASPIIEPIRIGQPLGLIIGDTGVRAPTRDTVGGVRTRWQANPDRFNALFAEIGRLVTAARLYLAVGNIAALGTALNRNQELLAEMGVSSPELERLIAAARAAGAIGAKLSGGGGGGIMLAVADETMREAVAEALLAAGAARITHAVVT